MPRFAQLVIGPAGCGKSTYCATLQDHCEALQRRVDVINLDPAAEHFDYSPLADIRDLIHVDDVMQDDDLHLGPNGGLIFCMEYLHQNLDWLDSAVGDNDCDYILFDCPGQIELYSHLNVIQRIIDYLQRKWDFRIVTIFVLDARFLIDTSHFMSGVLAALSAMTLLATSHINVMSKMDLLSEAKQRLVISRYLNPDFNAAFNNNDDDCVVTPTTSNSRGFGALNKALIELIDRYNVIHFFPLNREQEDSIGDLLREVDFCLQYDEEVEPQNRIFDEAEHELVGEELLTESRKSG